MSVNKCILVGNCCKDPEIRTTNDGREIASFSLATNESWKDRSTGEKKEKVEFHRIVVFSSGLVGIIKNYVKKGSKIYLEGQLQTRKWTDKSGVEKYTTEIVLQNFNSTLQLLSKSEGYESKNKAYQSEPEAETTPALDDMDDDIPF